MHLADCDVLIIVMFTWLIIDLASDPPPLVLGLGNPRGNENPFLLSFGILWYRFHNAVANKTADILWDAYQNTKVQSEFGFQKKYSRDDFLKHYDEKIFNEARKWVIATHQVCVSYIERHGYN